MLKNKIINFNFNSIIGEANIIESIPYYFAIFENETIDDIKKYADKFKAEKDGVALFVNRQNGFITLICAVSKNFTTKIKAKEFLQKIAKKAGGSAGGKDDFAQGGVKNFDSLIIALKDFGFNLK
jgi:alanyl-tRNA synthetase